MSSSNSGDPQNLEQQEAISRLEKIYKLTPLAVEHARLAFALLSAALAKTSLERTGNASERSLEIGNLRFYVVPGYPALESSVVDHIVDSPVLRFYASDGLLDDGALGRLLSDPEALRKLLGPHSFILGCMDTD